MIQRRLEMLSTDPGSGPSPGLGQCAMLNSHVQVKCSCGRRLRPSSPRATTCWRSRRPPTSWRCTALASRGTHLRFASPWISRSDVNAIALLVCQS